MAIRAPKQWTLTKNETITSFEAWRQNLQYTLSLDPNFASYLLEDSTWLKKTSTTPLRGFTDDTEPIPEASRRTAAQKLTHLELMLGQIANYCPIISRNTIVKNSTSVNQIWQAIRLHFGFQSCGSHFLDFNIIRLEPGERPEDLYQRINSFIEDNLLKSNGSISHHGDIPASDEDLSPTLENFIVLTWLRLVHPELPALVKQRYGTELRSKTLSSIKPEISQALDSLLEEIHTSQESKVLRSAIRNSNVSAFKSDPKQSVKARPSCPLCKQAGRPSQHFLSKCKYLPQTDKAYLSKSRLTTEFCDVQDCDSDIDDNPLSPENFSSENQPDTHSFRVVSTSRRVSTKQSPQMKVFYKQFPLQIILDSGAEISMIKTSVANYIGAPIQKSDQKALQADGVTPLSIAGETHLLLSRNGVNLKLEALVVNDLDIDILAGIPFLTINDIGLRPSKQEIIIGGSDVVCYGPPPCEPSIHRVRRTQAVVLRSPATSVIWPGEYLEVDLPDDFFPDCSISIEARPDNMKVPQNWPPPTILEAVCRKARIVNDSNEPKIIKKHEHFCQVRHTTELELSQSLGAPPVGHLSSKPLKSTLHSDLIKVDPDCILDTGMRSKFHDLHQDYDEVFNPQIAKYNGAFGAFEAKVNMGPTQPPQRKGKVPQYSRDRLVELQQRFDDLEDQGVFKRH